MIATESYTYTDQQIAHWAGVFTALKINIPFGLFITDPQRFMHWAEKRVGRLTATS